MPTQTKENYLKAIYFLEEHSGSASLTALSKAMAVSTPTVNNMVKKLNDIGWVNYKKYKPLKLTNKGRKEAALIVRKHRLTEMFLVQVMGFGWEEVHVMAEEIEHINNDDFFDRMDEILAYPTVDPHGSPIPDKNGVSKKKNYKQLAEMQPGDRVRLCAVSDSSIELLHLLNDKNIKLGIEIDLIKLEQFDKTMTIKFNDKKELSLSYEVCRRLLVEKIG